MITRFFGYLQQANEAVVSAGHPTLAGYYHATFRLLDATMWSPVAVAIGETVILLTLSLHPY